MSQSTLEHDRTDRKVQIDMILRQIDALPTLAPVAMRLVRIGNIEDADLDQLVEVIEADPPLTARLLGLCRRADKGLGDRITSLRRAVVMLGLETVQAAALSVAVFEAMQSCSSRVDDQVSAGVPGGAQGAVPESIFDRTGFWRHCIAVAAASERIAEQHPAFGVRPEEASVAGLLHDLGKLVFHVVLPRAYSRVLGHAERRHASSAEIESQVFGIDHHAAGCRIAEHWGLPDILRDVIWLRGQPFEALTDHPSRNLIIVVSIARALCRHLHLGWSGDFNHPELLEGPRGLCARSRSNSTADAASQLPAIELSLVQSCAEGLHEAVVQRGRTLGLGEQQTPQLLLQSLGAANRRLGRLSADFRARAFATQVQTAALEAIATLHAPGPPVPTHRGLPEALSAIVRSAARAFGEGFYATVHQLRPGDAWHISTFGSEGLLLRSHSIDTPHDRDTGRCRHLAELGRTSASLSTLGALPWLADHLLEAPDLGRVHLLSLASEADAPAAILLHDPKLLGDRLAMKALVASWSAAFGAAAQHETTRRFADTLASSNRALADAQAKIAEMQSLARMGEVAAGAAHEMNNPLAVISGRAELLAEQASSDADRKTAGAIVDAAGRLSNLITAMSSIANPPAPAPSPVALGDLLEEALRRAHAKLNTSSEVQIEADDPAAQAIIDRDLVADAISELIANALEAAPNGNVAVRTHIVPTDDRLIVTVNDDGAGMSPRAQQHAFDAFFSERPAGRRTGLGLTRARRLVELCGGHLRLESQIGEGTTATIELPLDPASHQWPAQEPSNSSPADFTREAA